MKHILIFLLLLTPLFAQVTPDSDYTIVRIKIIPEQVTIKTGERIHFQFIGLDARGFEVPAAFQWQYSGGTLTWNGYYTAGSRPGDYEIVATLPTTGISAKAKIKIISDQPELVQRKLMRLEIIPNKITLQPNQKMIFQMAAYDNYGDPMGVAMGIRFSGGNVVLADGPGQVEYTAGEQPGEYYLEVSTKEGITNRAHIIIQDKNTSNQQVQNYDNAIDRYKNQNTRTYVGENQREINEQNRDYEHARYSDRDYNRDRQNIQDYEQKQYENRYSSSTQYSSSQPIKRHIFIEPKWVSLMPNQTCKFTVKITDQYNKIISTQYGIEVEGGDLKEDGATFTAGDVPGEYKFVVTLPTGESEFAEIQIRRDPNAPEDSCLFRCTKETEPVYIEITPYDVQLSPNEQQHFTVTAYDVYNKQTNIGKYSVKVTGGQISPDGKIYTAGQKPGTYYYSIITDKKLEARARIRIHNPQYEAQQQQQYQDRGKLATLKIEPEKVRIHPGEKQPFKIIAKDKYGNQASAELRWTYRGGIMDANSVYTAGARPCQVTLTLKSGEHEAQAIVAIIPHDTPIHNLYWINITPNIVQLRPGESVQFQYNLTDDFNNPVHLQPEWEITGGTFNPRTLTYTAGNELGDYYLEATVNKNECIRTRIAIEIVR